MAIQIKVFDETFVWYYKFLEILQNEIDDFS